MPLPDNRLRFPGAKIDFATQVGNTGQDHDTVPSPGVARYDHILMWFIGLLSNQSSYQEPSECRDGTLWFDLNTQTLKINTNGEFKPLASVISVSSEQTLQDWYDQLSQYLETFGPEITFSGNVTSSVNNISIPESLRQYVTNNTRCYLHVNGLLKDPRSIQIQSLSIIRFSAFTLNPGDQFTVVLKEISDSYFYTPTVSVP